MTGTQGTHVVLLATGGTISSRADAHVDGASVAADAGSQVLSSLLSPPPYPVRVVDVACAGSYALTLDDMTEICAQIQLALADPTVRGVVVSHGTDTMEETAFLADLTHDSSRPVVFTGAQMSADAAVPDGPDNLARSIAVAGSPHTRGRGVLVCFAGQIFQARGVRKVQTFALMAFENPDFGVAGTVTRDGDVAMSQLQPRFEPLSLPKAGPGEQPRVDVVCAYPGADGTLLRAAVEAGARGIILQGTGSGNGNVSICSAVAEATQNGAVVILSTRVSAGPVVPVYGAGGGRDLVAAGAIPSGLLRPSQSLILLNLLLRLNHATADIVASFTRHGASTSAELIPQNSTREALK
jgi:L-asparaginase